MAKGRRKVFAQSPWLLVVLGWKLNGEFTKTVSQVQDVHHWTQNQSVTRLISHSLMNKRNNKVVCFQVSAHPSSLEESAAVMSAPSTAANQQPSSQTGADRPTSPASYPAMHPSLTHIRGLVLGQGRNHQTIRHQGKETMSRETGLHFLLLAPIRSERRGWCGFTQSEGCTSNLSLFTLVSKPKHIANSALFIFTSAGPDITFSSSFSSQRFNWL